MKHVWFLVLVVLAAIATDPPEVAIPYFTNVREVRITQPDQQNYLVVDEEIWNHSRPDLGDLRLYDGKSQLQYALSEQHAATSSEEVEAKILNLGKVAGHTEFDLDVEGIPEYDRIRLRLDARNFVVTASVAGSNVLAQRSALELTPTTLYDFTREQLGFNSVLKLPPSSFRYLHVRLTPGLVPQQVKSGSVFNLREKQALWTRAGMCGAPQQRQRTTVVACETPAKVPLSRIMFQIAPSQVNFHRNVSVENAKSVQIASGEISRVRVNRAGTLVTSEDLAVSVAATGSSQLTLVVDNADNPPLEFTAVQLLSLERRVYFDPHGATTLQLYYGDEKLSAPSYDYARYFHADDSSAEARLEAGTHNAAYTGRPDDRPWSERHMVVLWAAMLLAVLVLIALAIRGLRTQSHH